MTETKRIHKCRIIECNIFKKLETSIGLIWSAGTSSQARPGWKKVACWQL